MKKIIFVCVVDDLRNKKTSELRKKKKRNDKMPFFIYFFNHE